MKKLLLLIPLCICLCLPSLSFAQWTGGSLPGGWPGNLPGGWNNGSTILVKPKPGWGGSGNGNGRTVTIDPVKAWIDFDMGQILVGFAEEMGKTTVTVENAMGQVVSSYTCDTAVEWEVYLAIPNTEGFYTLNIYSAQYEGVGEFQL